MRIFRVACILAALGAVSGCESAADRSSIGSVEARAAAAPAVDAVVERLKAGAAGPVHVERGDPFMPFATAYHDLLVSQLTQAGVPVSPVRGGGLTVRYAVQPIADGDGNVVLTTQFLDDGTLAWSDTVSFLVPEPELVNFVAWAPRPAPVARPPAVADLPVKPMAVTGPGVADERAERIFRRSLRK